MVAFVLDLHDYLALPADVRREFDAWLDSEGLLKAKVFRIEFHEGGCTTHRYVVARDTGCIYVDSNGEPATARIRHDCTTTPPHSIAPYLRRDRAA